MKLITTNVCAHSSAFTRKVADNSAPLALKQEFHLKNDFHKPPIISGVIFRSADLAEPNTGNFPNQWSLRDTSASSFVKHFNVFQFAFI